MIQVKKKAPVSIGASLFTVICLESFFFDPCFFTAKAPEIEYPGPSHHTMLVYGNIFEERGRHWENPLNASIPGNFPNRECF